METTSSDRVEVIVSDDDAEDASCSTRAAPGAASPSDTDSDVAAGVELVDLVNDLADLADATGSGSGGNKHKRDRDESAERSASPSTSSRSVRLKPDKSPVKLHREQSGKTGVESRVSTASDSEDPRGSPSRGDSDSAARSAPGQRLKPLTPDRRPDAEANDVCVELPPKPGSGPAASDATAVNTAAAIETVLEGLARDEKLFEEDEAQFEKIPETMLAMPLLKHQRRAVSWMRRREAAGSSPRGGMLADDQGLGKTFSAIALIAANPPPPRRRASDGLDDKTNTSSKARKPAGGTLVVCPTSVLRQWQRELESKVSKSANMRVLVHHGVGRTKLAAELAAYDVVLTTFAVVGLEVAPSMDAPADETGPAPGFENKVISPSGGAVGGVEWFRVILDEAQSVKNARSQVAAAVSAVSSKCRWCLSGTPLQNNVDDLFSYFRFLRYEPYGDAASFRTLIKEPIRVDPASGFRRLQAILRAVMLRRTKQSRINGAPIVRLPPRTVVHFRRAFLPEEQKAYALLQAEYRGKMEEFAAAGTVSSNYVNLLHMLLRLRQACNHPSLVGGANRGDGAVTTSRFDRIGADGRGLNANAESRRDAAMSVGALPNEGGVFVKTPASAVAAARRLPAALRGMMRAAAEHGRCVCSICGDPPSDPTVASCCARPFCGDCVSPRVDALPAPTTSAGKKERNAAGAVAAADGLTADGFACPSCGTTLTRALLHSAAALVAADAPRANAGSSGVPAAQEKGLSAAEQRAPRNAPGGRLARGGAGAASGPSVEALMAGTKVRGIMDYLTALREKHKAVVAAAKAKATSRGKAQTQKFSPGGAAAAAAVAKGTQLRRGIRSSDAALAAALPPLAPVCAPGGAHQRGGSLSHAHALGGSGGSGSQKHAVPAAEKAIVFSQWTAMLDLLEPCLRAAEIKFRRLDGTMSLAARERALSEFEAKPEVTVILMSLKAAGLGVNLTCANHVLLSDVWWNPTAEEQAIDRAHRIGQTREVRVARFTVRDTVEDRILALQDRKRAMVAAAFGDEADDGFGGSSRRAQLTTEDLVFLFGSEKEA